jgi:hypothetical protein
VAGRFDATVVIDRPIEEVFDFLADGENDPKFSPRVLEIKKTTDGPPGVGTVYGGYDLAPEGEGTRVTIFNVLEGHGPGKLIAPLALRSARKGADEFGASIKRAVEASPPSPAST